MSTIGKITLYKKISKGKFHLGQEGENYFTTLGGFQHMSYKEYPNNKGLENLAKYAPSYEINGVRYSEFSIFFFGTDRYKTSPFPQGDLDNRLFYVSSLRLNKTLDLTRLYTNAEEMIDNVVAEIERAIDGQAKWKVKRPDVQIYPTLGSCDLVLIARGDSIDDLVDIWPLIRKIPIPNKSAEPLIRITNSFLSVFNKYNLNRIYTQKIPTVTLYKALKNLDSDGALKLIYEKYFEIKCSQESQKPPFHYVHGHGDFDVALRLDNCPLDKLLYLLGVRHGEALDINKSLVDAFDKYADDNIEASSMQIVCGSITVSNEELFEKYSDEEARRNFSPDDGDDLDADDLLVDNLRHHYALVRRQLPLTAQRTLDFLIDKCISLLKVKPNVAGIRLYKVMDRILYAWKDNTKSFINDDFTEVLGIINSMVHSILMADNLHSDFGVNDVETIYSGTKIYFAYENMLMKLTHAISNKKTGMNSSTKDTPIFFITVNPLTVLSSCHLVKQKDNMNSSNVFSLNFPHIGHFEPMYSIPYLGHELGHYIVTDKNLTIHCNKTYKELSEYYIKLYLWDNIKYQELNISKKDFLKLMEELFKAVDYNFEEIYKLPTRVFRRKYMEYFGMLCDYLQKIKVGLGIALEQNNGTSNEEEKANETNKLTEVDYYFYVAIYNSMRNLNRNNEAFLMLSELIKEARSDIVMTCICKYNFKQYLESFFRYMWYNNISLSLKDVQYTMRLAVVINALTDNDLDSVKRYLNSYDLNNKEYDHLSEVLDFLCHNSIMLEPLVNYLKEVRNYVFGQLGEGEEGKDVEGIKNTLDLFRHPMTERCRNLADSVDEIKNDIDMAKIIYHEWYDSLRNWNEEYSRVKEQLRG